MDFLDKLGKQASKTYKYTAEKTSKLAKEAKIKMSMNENKSKIEELYEEIGKEVYRHHVTDENYEVDTDIMGEVEEYCIQIDELCDRIEDERKELLSLKDKKQCPNCFEEIDKEFHYCPSCGASQEDEYIEDRKQEDEKQENEKQNNEEKEQEKDIEDE